MNCNEAQECMAQVWDLSAHHPVRVELNKHIEECPDCAFEYSMWEELYDLLNLKEVGASMMMCQLL